MLKNKFSRRLSMAVVLAALLLFSAAAAGRFLVVDAPRRSDVVVVLSGDVGDVRFRHALELLRRGYAQHLVLDAPDWIIYGRPASELAREYIRSTAPDKAAQLHVCSFAGDSTLFELREVSGCIRQISPGATSAIVVTSAFHTRRALSTAQRAVPQYKWSVGSAADEIRFGTAWWRNREWAKTTFTEWQKLCWWMAIERWSK